MRDDERYPIPAQTFPDSELPQVVPGSQLPDAHSPNPQDKFIAPGAAVDSPSRDVAGAGKDEQSSTPKARGAICGLRRRTFFIVAGVIALGLIAALVGGLVGGLNSRKSKSGGGSGDSDGSDDDPPSPTPTGPLDPSKRSLAAGTTSGSADSTLQVFYQDLDTTDVLYRLVWSDKAKDEQRTELDITPMQGTPLAVTSSNTTDGNGVDVNLFYLTINDTSDVSIVRAALECSNEADTCSTASNEVISGVLSNGVDPKSDLSAVLLNNEASRFRVYYQAPGAVIWVLVADDPSGSDDWSAHQIGGPAPHGTGIAATVEKDEGSLMVAYVYNDTQVIRAVEYTDAIGAQGGKDIDRRSGSGFTPTSRITASYTPKYDQYLIYYVGSSSHEIVGYFRTGTEDSWEGSQAKQWGKADGDIAAVSWLKQVRLLYMSDGKLAMNRRVGGGDWSDVEYL